MTDILGIGAPCVDTIVFVTDNFLEECNLEKGSVIPIDRQTLQYLLQKADGAPVLTPGGSCCNVLRALSHLGWSCGLAGKIGKDSAGEFLKSQLDEQKIAFYGTQNESPTAQILCFITPDGERTMRDLLGASAEMQGDNLLPSHFYEKRLVHIDGYTLYNKELTEKAMQLAVESQALVSFDLANFKIVNNYKKSLMRIIPQYVDIIFANAQEAFELLAAPPKEACEELSRWCKYAVVTQSEKGCYVGHAGIVQHLPAIPPAKLIDTTGAGDLFAAGFLDGILQKLPVEICGWQGTFLATQVLGQQGACLPAEKWPEILTHLTQKEQIKKQIF